MKANNQPIKPAVGSLSDLEHRLGSKRGELVALLQSRRELYRPFQTTKKPHPYPGVRRKAETKPPKTRDIDNPVKQLKDIQTRIRKNILSRAELPKYMFGAVAGGTLTKHAEQHVPNQGTVAVSMDISSYYPNITCVHVYYVWHVVLGCPPRIASLLTELTTYDWHLPQGAPTSPAIANIFLASVYAPICLACEKAGVAITTWVDDLIFSGKEARSVMETVRATLAEQGFKMAPKKRKIQGPRDEQQMTGTRLGRHSVRVPHGKMDELRAAIHRLAMGTVPPEEMEKYMRNLCGRIAHIGSIHKGDAAKMKRYAAKSGVQLA
jgi:RNA-directed DNA polymerase